VLTIGVAQGVSGRGETRTVDAGAGEEDADSVVEREVWSWPTGQMVV
jgi:hypothetical protein